MTTRPTDLQETLGKPRTALMKGLSEGIWSQGEVHINRKKGRGWENVGHTQDGKTVLTSEEALFMMECGSLEVMVDGLPSTVQQAYHSFLPVHTLPTYQSYSWLKRAGRKVRLRTNPPPDSQRTNKPVLEVSRPSAPPLQLFTAMLGDEVPGPSLSGSVGVCLCDTHSIAYYSLTPFVIEDCM